MVRFFGRFSYNLGSVTTPLLQSVFEVVIYRPLSVLLLLSAILSTISSLYLELRPLSVDVPMRAVKIEIYRDVVSFLDLRL